MLRGAEGFSVKHHLRTDHLLTLSEDLPLVSIALDTRARIEALLDDVLAVKRHGLVTLERARMLTGSSGPVMLAEQVHDATKLTSYVGRQERGGGVPAFVAICDLLRRRELAGATVLLGVDGTVHGGRRRRPLLTLERVRVCRRDGELPARHVSLVRRLRQSGAAGATCVRGVWGFHGDHAPQRLLQLRRRVPIVTTIVDTPERIAASFQIVDELTQPLGLVTSEMVPAMAAIADGVRHRGGLRLAHHMF